MDTYICGTLKFENLAKKIGDIVPVVNLSTERHGKAVWGGFAKLEKINGVWRRSDPIDIAIDGATSIIEKSIQLKVRGRIQAIGLRKDLIIRGTIIGHKSTIKIVTRPASTAFEKTVHHRWPKILTPEGNMQEFTHRDILI